MNSTVSWLLELKINQDRQAELQHLMEEMVQVTEANEPGALNYVWSLSADGKWCHIYERYADSAAVMTHLVTFGGRFAGRFLELLRPVRFVVYGSPNETVKAALTDFNPMYMEPAVGFQR